MGICVRKLLLSEHLLGLIDSEIFKLRGWEALEVIKTPSRCF